MKLSTIEEKILFRAARSSRVGGRRDLEDLIREGKEIPPDKYVIAIDCLETASDLSKDLAFVRACDALRAKFKAVK